jgi:hypothetical protein
MMLERVLNERQNTCKGRLNVGQLDLDYDSQNIESLIKFLVIYKNTLPCFANLWNPEVSPSSWTFDPINLTTDEDLPFRQLTVPEHFLEFTMPSYILQKVI